MYINSALTDHNQVWVFWRNVMKPLKLHSIGEPTSDWWVSRRCHFQVIHSLKRLSFDLALKVGLQKLRAGFGKLAMQGLMNFFPSFFLLLLLSFPPSSLSSFFAFLLLRFPPSFFSTFFLPFLPSFPPSFFYSFLFLLLSHHPVVPVTSAMPMIHHISEKFQVRSSILRPFLEQLVLVLAVGTQLDRISSKDIYSRNKN